MFKKSKTCQIDFISEDPEVVEHFSPKPAKKVIPEWYKNLDMTSTQGMFLNNLTVKNCVPVSDMLTSGYIIFNSWETDLKHLATPNMVNSPAGKVEQKIKWRTGTGMDDHSNPHVLTHAYHQCPVKPNGFETDFFKIINEWTIKTPPGYSCLIMQPFYFFESRYTMLPAIVDTDSHTAPVHFTGYLNTKETVTIPAGHPLVQVIPFKRDTWTMTASFKEHVVPFFKYLLQREENIGKATKWYKNLCHSKKRFD